MTMRILSMVGACLLAVLLGAATPVRDWSQSARATPDGAVVIGSPQARVKLVEYASYTCSHCAHFSSASAPVLRGQMIRSGSTSLEFRHLIRDRLDLAAAVLARCAGPRRFAGTSEAIFAAQDRWLPQGAAFDQANAERMAQLAAEARLRALADGAGLTGMVKARGLGEPAIAACFADRAAIDRIVAMTNNAPASVTGTPAFFINGKPAGAADWAHLEPVLRAQGAK